MKFLKLTLALSVVAAAVGIFASNTDAYSTGAKWSNNTTSYYINPANADGQDAGAVINALQTGASDWFTQSGASFNLVYSGTTNINYHANDGKNVVFFRQDPYGADSLASTYGWWSSSTMRFIDVDIFFNDPLINLHATDGTCGGSWAVYIRDLSDHEWGHFFGMNHATDLSATMYPAYYNCDTNQRTLAADDINGIRSLYGTGPLPPPPPAPNPPPPPPPAPIAPAISLNPASMSFSSSTGVVPASKSVTISNTGTAALNWTGSANQPWCSITPASGSVASGSSAAVTVSLQAMAIADVYSCSVAISDPYASNSPRYVSVNYTVTEADTTPPTVTITQPINGSKIPSKGKVNVAAIASDSRGIAKIEIYIDNSVVKTCNNITSCSYSWNMVKVSAGSHGIKATATDKSGLQSQTTYTVSK